MRYLLGGVVVLALVVVLFVLTRGTATNPGEMIFVPAGTFEMGIPPEEAAHVTAPVHAVTLSAYEIGKYEVTNLEYAKVLNWARTEGRLETVSSVTVEAFGHRLIDISLDPHVSDQCQIEYVGSEFDVKIRQRRSMADYPVIKVSWFGAAAYCNWLSEIEGLQPCYDTNTWVCDFSKSGYRLPTEAEWERAAGWDGSKHLRYGNGSDEIDGNSANYSLMAADRRIQRVSTGPNSYAYGGALPVGYFNGRRGTRNSPSPIGAYDMSGNVNEWCNDWWSYLSPSSATDPTGPDTGEHRSIRGGGSTESSDATFCRSGVRHFAGEPGLCLYGFRVARSVSAH